MALLAQTLLVTARSSSPCRPAVLVARSTHLSVITLAFVSLMPGPAAQVLGGLASVLAELAVTGLFDGIRMQPVVGPAAVFMLQAHRLFLGPELFSVRPSLPVYLTLLLFETACSPEVAT